MVTKLAIYSLHFLSTPFNFKQQNCGSKKKNQKCPPRNPFFGLKFKVNIRKECTDGARLDLAACFVLQLGLPDVLHMHTHMSIYVSIHFRPQPIGPGGHFTYDVRCIVYLAFRSSM